MQANIPAGAKSLIHCSPAFRPFQQNETRLDFSQEMCSQLDSTSLPSMRFCISASSKSQNP